MEGPIPDEWEYTGRGSDYWTKFINIHKEYRVHGFQDETILAQKKVWDADLFDEVCEDLSPEQRTLLEDEAEYIHNYGHGWKFVHFNDLKNVPQNVLRWGVPAVKALDLDFGAVDIITTDEKDEHGLRKAYVLEVNSAPALEGPSLEAYLTKFSNILGKLNGAQQ